MSKTEKIILAAVVLVVGFIWWRRHQQAAQAYGTTAATPSPYTAITALQTNVQQLPGLATSAAIEYAGRLLPPVVGQGITAIIPQSSPRPTGGYDPSGLTADQISQLEKIAPEGRAAVANDWRRVAAEKAAGAYKPSGFGGAVATALGRLSTPVAAYNPSAGYYG